MPNLPIPEGAEELVAEALRADVLRRQRVATRLAGELIPEAEAGTDVRSGSVRIARLLMDAATLDGLADALRSPEALEAAASAAAAPPQPRRRRRRAVDPDEAPSPADGESGANAAALAPASLPDAPLEGPGTPSPATEAAAVDTERDVVDLELDELTEAEADLVRVLEDGPT